LRGPLALRAGNLLRRWPSVVARPFNLRCLYAPQLTIGAANKSLARNAVAPWVLSKDGGDFFLTVVKPINFGPLRPGVVGRPLGRRSRQNFELDQTLAALSQGSAHAVRAGIATTNDNHVLVLCGEVVSIFVVTVQQASGVAVQKLHREMNSPQVPALDGQIAWACRAAAKHHRVKLLHQSFDRIVMTDVSARNELNTLGSHQVRAPLYHALFQFHV